MSKWTEKWGWHLGLYGGQIGELSTWWMDVRKHCQTNKLHAEACRERCRQTDLASASASGGLSYSAWGLRSFCSPPTPDLLPPDSSHAINSHFLFIQYPPPLALLFWRTSVSQHIQCHSLWESCFWLLCMYNVLTKPFLTNILVKLDGISRKNCFSASVLRQGDVQYNACFLYFFN